MLYLYLILFIVGLLFCLTVFAGAPFVPTHSKNFQKLLKKIAPDKQVDVLVDLGSGDGRILRMASPSVKQVIGYEINPLLWLYAISRIKLSPISNARVFLGDFRQLALPSQTTIVYVFSAGIFKKQIIKLLKNHIRATSRPLTFVSYGFEFSELGETQEYSGFFIYKLKIKDFTKKEKTGII